LPQLLTKPFLVDSFRSLGIKPGTRLVVHSALRSLGPIENGADTVLDALIECIGQSGLLIVPTFTYNNDVFDPETTPSRTGILTEILRKRPGAVRSLHPTHSVAAIGEGAAEVCEGHHLLPGLGIDSPLDRVAKAGGGILLLGVGHVSNSTVHVGEAYARVHYLDIPFNPDSPTRIPVMGSVRLDVELYNPPGCSLAFGIIEASLRQRGSIRDGLIGKGPVQWMPGQQVIDSAMALLHRDAAALLCSNPGCYRCSHGRARLSR
jgi:aminoglycoside 3-N-acetyltransferase